MSTIVVTPTQGIEVINNEILISVVNNEIVVEIGGQGAPGRGVPAGGLTGQSLIKASDDSFDTEWATIGSINTIAIAGQSISALKIVYTDPATGKLFYADKNDVATVKSLLGMATQAGDENEEINVITSGVIIDAHWNWNMAGNVSLFLNSNGDIVQGAPNGSVSVRIGYAITATSIMVRLGEPILTI